MSRDVRSIALLRVTARTVPDPYDFGPCPSCESIKLFSKESVLQLFRGKFSPQSLSSISGIIQSRCLHVGVGEELFES
jgi:hypothetical protein